MSPELNAHGVSLSPPAGFEGRVFRRPAFGEVSAAAADGPPAPNGEIPNVVVHVSTIALPTDIGDFASGAVDRLQSDDVLIVLFEYDTASAKTALFANRGIPRTLTADDFSPSVLQRSIPGQAGYQYFFNDGGRAFCLYAVIGSFARRADLVPKVNAVLATVQIEPLPPSSAATTSPATTSTTTTTTTTTTLPPPPSTAPTVPGPSNTSPTVP